MADITIGGLPLQTVANDTDITHIQSSGEDKRISIENISKNLPIGYIYTQYPNKDSPSDLGLVGTWTNVSSTFAGNFFRAEGGLASAFESGQQAHAVQEHAHISVLVEQGSAGGVFDRSAGYGGGSTNATIPQRTADAKVQFSGNKNANETRVDNETIRIWERTA